MLHRQPTIAEMRAALEASAREMTPLEHFERMVRDGLINRKGQLTKRYGGEGELEPDARPATEGSDSSNGERR
jgi:hypothetical protein